MKKIPIHTHTHAVNTAASASTYNIYAFSDLLPYKCIFDMLSHFKHNLLTHRKPSTVCRSNPTQSAHLLPSSTPNTVQRPRTVCWMFSLVKHSRDTALRRLQPGAVERASRSPAPGPRQRRIPLIRVTLRGPAPGEQFNTHFAVLLSWRLWSTPHISYFSSLLIFCIYCTLLIIQCKKHFVRCDVNTPVSIV